MSDACWSCGPKKIRNYQYCTKCQPWFPQLLHFSCKYKSSPSGRKTLLNKDEHLIYIPFPNSTSPLILILPYDFGNFSCMYPLDWSIPSVMSFDEIDLSNIELASLSIETIYLLFQQFHLEYDFRDELNIIREFESDIKKYNSASIYHKLKSMIIVDVDRCIKNLSSFVGIDYLAKIILEYGIGNLFKLYETMKIIDANIIKDLHS